VQEEEPAIPLSPPAPRTQQVKKLNKIHPCWLAIPAFFDFFASSLLNVALIMVPASVY
jgi:hypothetical protein